MEPTDRKPEPRSTLISESIKPDAGTFDASAMARGQPGLPTGFTWRDRHYQIVKVLSDWKVSEAEGHRTGGERYYRKHCFRIDTACGATMVIYAVRHTKSGENKRRRWWLYVIEEQRDVQSNTGEAGPREALRAVAEDNRPNVEPHTPHKN